eukprot:COSAG06_NODE_2085_length_7634_cov_6.358593_4_plen_246_part_01
MLARILSKSTTAAAPRAEKPINSPGHWDFFLSHGQAAAGNQVKVLCLLLRARGKTVWYDNEMQSRDTAAMKEGVQHSANFLLFLSGDPPLGQAQENQPAQQQIDCGKMLQPVCRCWPCSACYVERESSDGLHTPLLSLSADSESAGGDRGGCGCCCLTSRRPSDDIESGRDWSPRSDEQEGSTSQQYKKGEATQMSMLLHLELTVAVRVDGESGRVYDAPEQVSVSVPDDLAELHSALAAEMRVKV